MATKMVVRLVNVDPQEKTARSIEMGPHLQLRRA